MTAKSPFVIQTHFWTSLGKRMDIHSLRWGNGVRMFTNKVYINIGLNFILFVTIYVCRYIVQENIIQTLYKMAPDDIEKRYIYNIY